MDSSFYFNKTILVTGHTGFKGAWLCAWLKKLGAKVIGLSLPPPENRPNLFESAHIAEGMTSLYGDINNIEIVRETLTQHQPELIFHLAAQALVRPAYRDPITTYMTNVMGTVHILEAARACPSVQSILVITTDKCYQNNEWEWGYREIDALGGKDPYSASKACAELVIKSYQESLLPLEGHIKLASARGGNVIGGGDWSEDRLIPDLVAALQTNQPIILRNPDATRPWQHVLELLRGYLSLMEKLASGDKQYLSAWNFGPERTNEVSVEWITRQFAHIWGTPNADIQIIRQPLPEARFLRLDSSKAQALLNWRPTLNIEKSLQLTAHWYQQITMHPDSAARLVEQQITEYTHAL